LRAWIGSIAIAVCAALAVYPSVSVRAASTMQTNAVQVNWYGTSIVKLTLTPNYASGFGTVKAVFGTQPTPSPGPGSCLDGCAVDFGPVIAGTNYLYKFATHLNVTTNDPNGVNVYGEGAADFFNQADSTTVPLNQAVYYLTSTSGGTDNNTGFSPSFPFYKTSGTVTGNSFSTAPTIAYTTFPSPIAQTTSASAADLYYDYQLKAPPAATAGQYYVWIVYTVVAR
jgi:hypothetical protein